MQGHECYHCKQWVAKDEPHDCWTTTEAALTRDLSDDLMDAWERLRETAVEFGEQRIYASHHSIMFSRKACYFFVRPKPKYLEVCIFLPLVEKSPRILKVYESSTVKTGEQTGYLFNAAGDHSFMQDFSVRQLANTLNKTAVRHISFQLTSTGTAGAEIWIKEIRYGVRTHPSIVFYFDDQHITQYTVAKPILDRYGLKSTLCISRHYLLNDQGSGIYMSEENVQTMFDAGHEVVSHSWNHGSYGSMTYQQIYDDAKLTKDLLDSRGWNRNGSEHLFTYPNGSAPTEANMGALTSLGYTYGRGARTYNVERYQQHTYGGVDYPMRLLAWGLSRPPRTITAMANNGSGAYRVTAAGHGFSSDEWVDISGTSTTADGTWQVTYVSSSQFDLVGPSFGSNTTGVARQSRKEWERRVQMAIRFGATCHVLVHQVGAGGVPVDVGYVTDVEFDPFIQFCARHVQSNMLDWRTFPEWVNGLTNPRRTRY